MREFTERYKEQLRDSERNRDVHRSLVETHQEDVDPAWITRSDGRRQRVRNYIVAPGGHFVPSHVEIMSVPELVSFWDQPDLAGHRITCIIDVVQLLAAGHVFTQEEDDYWVLESNHEPHTYQGFKAVVLSVLKEGYRFEEQIHHGGKNCCIPRINREGGEPVDGRHRAAIACALGATHLPVGIHTSDRYFDNGDRATNEAIQMITEFFKTPEWEEYKKSESYRILTVR